MGDVVTVAASVLDHLPGHSLADFLREPETFSFHTTRVQTFPGLQNYESLGFHFNIPVVLAATGVLFPMSALLLFSHLWERVWKETVFGAEEPEREPIVLCGVDCSAYPIFASPRVVKAVAFAERWHHGQHRRSGEPYVTHCIEAARILAALLPASAESRKYVDTVVACILHDVVDDTECEIDDVEAAFGSRVAKLVSDVSTLGKLPQILRRYQRRGIETVGGEGGEGGAEGPLAEDVGRLEVEELVKLRKLLLVMVDDPRVFLIKIADRLHNMRTLYAVDTMKGKFVANETLQVWCSFAEQLGLFGAKAEMEDLAFAVVDPEAFRAVLNARVHEWVTNDVYTKRKSSKTKSREKIGAEAGAEADSKAEGNGIVTDLHVDAPPPRFQSAWTWEPMDVTGFFERVMRGENAGKPRNREKSRGPSKDEMKRIRMAAQAAVREEERLKRAKPMTVDQEETRAMLACVPPFDLILASRRNSKLAAAAAAATAAADAATAATAALVSGDDRRVSFASLEASLLALRSCQDAVLRSLQLDSVVPGLRVEIAGRLKSVYSTHLKMQRKKVPFNQICDARALRLVVGEPGEVPGTKDEVEACFVLLEAIHKLYRPVPGEYDDYITNKKKSGYQSLHTAVVGPDGALLEFQVRTRAMHDAAEFGNAAHWLYKDLSSQGGQVGDAATGKGGNAAAVETTESAPAFEAPEVGQPVQIVEDRERGVGFSAGVVCYAKGSRMRIVQAMRGDTLAPDISSTGLVNTAEWVAMDLHTALLERAVLTKRIEPRQAGPGYFVLEFAMCSDGRWHKVDAYGRKLATTAELLDVEALLEALEFAAAEADAEAEAEAEARGEVDAMEKAKEESAAPAMSLAPADEVVAAFEARLTAAATREAVAAEGSERSSFFDAAAGPAATEGDAGAQVAGVPASPDDEMVDSRVRAMQSTLWAYLDDSPEGNKERATKSSGGSIDDDEDDDDDHITPVKEESAAMTAASAAPGERHIKAAKELLRCFGVAEVDDVKTRPLSVEEAIAHAREELQSASARAAEEAAAARRQSRRAKREAAWRSGKTESPLFSIVRAELKSGSGREKPDRTDLEILDPEEEAQLEEKIGLKLRAAEAKLNREKEASKAD